MATILKADSMTMLDPAMVKEKLREQLVIGARMKHVREGHLLCGSLAREIGTVVFVGYLGDCKEIRPSARAQKKMGFVLYAKNNYYACYIYYAMEELYAGDVAFIEEKVMSQQDAKPVQAGESAFERRDVLFSKDGNEVLAVTPTGVYIKGKLAANPLEVINEARDYLLHVVRTKDEELTKLRRDLANAKRGAEADEHDLMARIDSVKRVNQELTVELTWHRNELFRHDPKLVNAHERNLGKFLAANERQS